MTQPEEMKTKAYVYGVEKLDGYDAWALFKACALGDVPKVKTLLAKDRRLVNAQFCYQFPIHMAVREGHAEIVEWLLDQGEDPGQSRYTYNSWDNLLLRARARGHRQVESLLQRVLLKRFNYTPDFEPRAGLFSSSINQQLERVWPASIIKGGDSSVWSLSLTMTAIKSG